MMKKSKNVCVHLMLKSNFTAAVLFSPIYNEIVKKLIIPLSYPQTFDMSAQFFNCEVQHSDKHFLTVSA